MPETKQKVVLELDENLALYINNACAMVHCCLTGNIMGQLEAIRQAHVLIEKDVDKINAFEKAFQKSFEAAWPDRETRKESDFGCSHCTCDKGEECCFCGQILT